jgi:hypothetical protein
VEVKKQVVIGDDTYGIRKLSWKSLEKAAAAKDTAQVNSLKAYGPELLKALRSPEVVDEAVKAHAAKKEDQKAKAQERYDMYDREAILTAGLETRNEEKLTPDQILNDLDKPTAETLHHAIVDLSDPLPEAAEAVQGKS